MFYCLVYEHLKFLTFVQGTFLKIVISYPSHRNRELWGCSYPVDRGMKKVNCQRGLFWKYRLKLCGDLWHRCCRLV